MASYAGAEVESNGTRYKLMWPCRKGWWCKRWLKMAKTHPWATPDGPGWSEGCVLVPHQTMDPLLGIMGRAAQRAASK